MRQNEVWNLPDTSPESAYQFGLMVAGMVQAAMEEAVQSAADVNVEEFRKGLTEGFKAFDLAIGADFWRKEPAAGAGKRRVTAARAARSANRADAVRVAEENAASDVGSSLQ